MSYRYFFKQAGEKVRACKEFYLKTLNIDAKRIVNMHQSKNKFTGCPLQYRWGRHVKKSAEEAKKVIRKHIESTYITSFLLFVSFISL